MRKTRHQGWGGRRWARHKRMWEVRAVQKTNRLFIESAGFEGRHSALGGVNVERDGRDSYFWGGESRVSPMGKILLQTENQERVGIAATSEKGYL